MPRNKIEVEVILKDALSKAWAGMVQQFGFSAAQMIQQIPQITMEIVNLGASVEAAERRFVAFSGGPDEAAKMLEAFNRGAGKTVSQMGAMEKSAKLLQMGLVSNADEMELMSRMAINLGFSHLSAKERIDDFSMMLANQAVRRLDNFGMSSGKVRDRINELLETGAALNREQAFKMAVMEEGSVALAKLGDTSDLARTKLDVVGASFNTMKEAAAGVATNMLLAQTNTNELAKTLDFLTGMINDETSAVRQLAKAWAFLNKWMPPMWVPRLLGKGFNALRDALDDSKMSAEEAVAAYKDVNIALTEAPSIVSRVVTAYNGYQVAAYESTLAAYKFRAELKTFEGVTLDNLAAFTQLHVSTVMATDDTNRLSEAERAAIAQKKNMAESQRTQNRLLWDAQQAQREYADRAREAAEVAANEAAVAAEILANEMESLRVTTANATIAQVDLAAQLMDASGAQVASAMINMVTASYQAGTISGEVYRTVVQGLQLQFGLATPETIKLAGAMSALNSALEGGTIDADALASQLANLDAFKAQQLQAIENANAQKAHAAATRAATQASKDQERALREEERAQAAAARAAENHAMAQARLAETLVDATQVEVARIAIQKLGESLRNGEISVAKYERLVAKLQLAFGLATNESIQMATGLEMLMEMMSGGEMKGKDFIQALRDLMAAAGTESLNTPEPEPPSVPAQGGDNTEFNMVIHTNAPAAAVQQDFATMAALAGR